LSRYLYLLEKWNRAYNLTAIRSLPDMLTHHVLDALSVQAWVAGDRLLDVGTGAGLPGIPLAIFNPGRRFLLLDSNGKKTRFLQQVIADLGLENVAVVQERSEHLVDKPGFDMILSRAFASLTDMIAVTVHLLAPNGCWLAMKGTLPAAELTALPAGLQEPTVIPVEVPGLGAERHFVILRKQKIVDKPRVQS
jgi:16S rRNA (guanine527-N7)-methyltransferase